MRKPNIFDFIRLAEVLRPIVSEVFKFNKVGEVIEVKFSLVKTGKKPWHVKLHGKPEVKTLGE